MVRQSIKQSEFLLYEKREFLSGYRLLWMMIMFDLPTNTAMERKSANKFRHYLMDYGFAMAQYSIYFKAIADQKKANRVIRDVKKNAPDLGQIQILTITDKQYENIVSIRNFKQEPPKKHNQLCLF